MTTFKDFEAYLKEMYVTLKLDDSGCRIHSISDGDKETVTMKGMWSCRGRWLPDMAKT